MEQEKYSLDRNMKNKNYYLNIISELTWISIEKIEKLWYEKFIYWILFFIINIFLACT